MGRGAPLLVRRTTEGGGVRPKTGAEADGALYTSLTSGAAGELRPVHRCADAGVTAIFVRPQEYSSNNHWTAGEFFEDGRELDREATAEEMKMLQYNAQACDILFNGLCPEEFNKISRLENAKEIWDTLVDMHGGTESVKESKLDVLQS
ncbi:uncharacterized protein [Aegilops tauschii subsp. strangulata]|uniref:uncharacterized protein n=1 Tax=Aegilops tauschii subsp. strangulata TaxID=200361 RepID=UPI00098AA9FE|nr:uncharacterized protein LOC109737921 [Aegilops tauschii subsp. strangulata]